MSDNSKLRAQIVEVNKNLSRLRKQYLNNKVYKTGANLGEMLGELGAYTTYLGELFAQVKFRYYTALQKALTEEWTQYHEQMELYEKWVSGGKKGSPPPKPTVTAVENMVAMRVGDIKPYKEELEELVKTWTNESTRWQSRLRDLNEEARANR